MTCAWPPEIACAPHVRRAILALTLIIGLASPAAAQAATAVMHSWRANLDSDPHMEHVQLVLMRRTNAAGVSIRRHWLQIVDRVGGRTVTVRITPVLEHLRPRWVRFGDFNARGGLEIFYHGFDGGAGDVPVSAGIRGWTGTAKRLLWSYAPQYPPLMHDGHHYRYAGASAVLENLASAGAPGLEVHLVQGEARPADPDCCPSRELVRNYRFSPSADGWVLYRKVWKPAEPWPSRSGRPPPGRPRSRPPSRAAARSCRSAGARSPGTG